MAQGEPIKFPGWPRGMDNRSKETAVPDGCLRDGLNVDVLNSGKARLRYGPGTQTFADSGAHSVFSDGKKLLWATANALKCGSPGGSPTTVLGDARLADPLSWVELHGRSYFSNEKVNGLVNVLGSYEPWGIIPPATAPVLSTPLVGNRIVQVTCVFLVHTVALDGTLVLEESGAPVPATIGCNDLGFVTVSAIPQSSDARYAGTRLYVSDLDGEELYREVDLAPGVTVWFLNWSKSPFGKGEILKTLLNSNMPPGQLIEYHDGAMYVASGNILYHSPALRYTMLDNDRHFVMFPERITLLKAVPQGASRLERPGLFISADKTYFLEDAGSKESQLRRVLDYKAIEGAAMHLPESNDVMWLSERGFVKGTSGGRVTNLTEKQIAMDKFERAAMGLLERDGHRAVMAVGTSSAPTPLLSSDWSADEEERVENVQ